MYCRRQAWAPAEIFSGVCTKNLFFHYVCFSSSMRVSADTYHPYFVRQKHISVFQIFDVLY